MPGFDRHIASDRRRSEERWAGRFEKQGEGESELIKRIDELMVDEAGAPLIRLGVHSDHGLPYFEVEV